jgi:uncharacterized membrane protein YtjA (UPF0391 family)
MKSSVRPFRAANRNNYGFSNAVVNFEASVPYVLRFRGELRRSYIIDHVNRRANTVNYLQGGESPCRPVPATFRIRETFNNSTASPVSFRIAKLCTKSTFRASKRPVRGCSAYSREGETMLRWAVIFLIVALIAAAFGFLGIAAAAAGIARVLFFIFLILFLVSLAGGLVRRT